MAGFVSTADVATVLAVAETVEHVSRAERAAMTRVRNAVVAAAPPVVVDVTFPPDQAGA
jgi:hypothetical protein